MPDAGIRYQFPGEEPSFSRLVRAIQGLKKELEEHVLAPHGLTFAQWDLLIHIEYAEAKAEEDVSNAQALSEFCEWYQPNGDVRRRMYLLEGEANENNDRQHPPYVKRAPYPKKKENGDVVEAAQKKMVRLTSQGRKVVRDIRNQMRRFKSRISQDIIDRIDAALEDSRPERDPEVKRV